MKLWIERKVLNGRIPGESFNLYRKSVPKDFGPGMIPTEFLVWLEDPSFGDEWVNSSVTAEEIAKLPSVEV